MAEKKRGGFDLNDTTKRKNIDGHSWFFGIGINVYLEFPDLNNAVKDVKDIKSVLVKKYNQPEEKSYLILDDEAIEENIIDRFDKLAEDVKENDRLVIYYSGHGHLNTTTGLGYWIPHDAKKDKTSRYIRNSTIHEYIKVIKAKHILLISDSCFSGSLFSRGGNRSTDTSIDELDTIASRWAICSGRHDEEVYDGQPGGNSPFAESILDTLLNNQKKALNVSKLSERIMEQTRSNYQQLPEGSPLYGVGHKGGQYIFKMKADEKESWAMALKLQTLDAYQDYADNHPSGKNINEAREKIKAFKDELAWAEAVRKNSITGYINYDESFPEGKYSKEALDAIKTVEEDKLWRTATRKPTLYNYRNYIKTYPNGKYKDEAQKAMSAMLADQTSEGLKEMEPVKEYDKIDEKPAVKEEKPNPFKEEPVAKKKTDVTADPFEEAKEVTADPFVDKKYTGTPPGEVNLFKKYWKFGAGALGFIVLILLINALIGGVDILNIENIVATEEGDNIRVDGVVTDLDFEPMIGATVLVKGTTHGTFTDIDGKYSVSFPKTNEKAWLVFSYTGYETVEVEVVLGENNFH